MDKKEIVLSEEHEALLRTALQIDDQRRNTPDEALEMYQELRVSLRRLGCSMSVEFIALVPVLLNRVARPEPQTFMDEIKEATDEVKYGTRVIAKFRKKWQAGRFLKMAGSQVVVVLDDDTAEERRLGPTAVRLATREDLKKLGEPNE
jgi:hypothetical protein